MSLCPVPWLTLDGINRLRYKLTRQLLNLLAARMQSIIDMDTVPLHIILRSSAYHGMYGLTLR